MAAVERCRAARSCPRRLSAAADTFALGVSAASPVQAGDRSCSLGSAGVDAARTQRGPSAAQDARLPAPALNDKARDLPDTRVLHIADAVIHAVPAEPGVGARAA
jgi:hypothetical protein